MKTKNKIILFILMITLLLILKPNTASAVTIDDTSNFRLVTSNLNLRKGPSTDYDKILIIPANRTVKYLGTTSNNFIKVSYYGEIGYVSKDYVKNVSNASPRKVVADALNFRKGPSTDDSIIGSIPQNAIVTYWGNATSEFVEVSYKGNIGWVSRKYLSTVSDTDSSTSTSTSTSSKDALRLVVASSLNLRSGPSTSYSVKLSIPQYATVTYLGEKSGTSPNVFAKVNYNGTTGWVSASYLSTFQCSQISDSSRLVLSNLNLRSGPSTSYSVKLTIPKGSLVTYSGNKQNGFAEVSYKGTMGWVSASYLAAFDTEYASNSNTNSPGSSANRIHNIGLASKTISTTVIMPGESFSALAILGNCNKEKGYKEAPVIITDSNGNPKTVLDYGGGVCQVSTTINIAVKKLGIKTERYEHNDRVSYAKREDEAAISYYGGKDLKFTNTLNKPIMLTLVSANGNCACIVYTLNTK